MRHRIRCLLGVLAIVATSPLDAQPLASPGVRARVIRLPGKHVAHVGLVERAGPDSVVLRDASGALWRIPLGTAHRLEVSTGRKRHLLKGALIGGATGALGGTLIGVAADEDADSEYLARCRQASSSCSSGGRWFDGIEVGIGAAIGGASGLIVGGVIGAIPRETWRAAALPRQAALGPTPDGRGIVVSVPLGHRRR